MWSKHRSVADGQTSPLAC